MFAALNTQIAKFEANARQIIREPKISLFINFISMYAYFSLC